MQLPLYKYFKLKNDSAIPIKIVGYQPSTYVNIKDHNKSYIIQLIKINMANDDNTGSIVLAALLFIAAFIAFLYILSEVFFVNL
jgi:hypothetical protein